MTTAPTLPAAAAASLDKAPDRERRASRAERRAAERTLAERHRWGDPQAFEEVYRTHAHLVYNLALRLAGDPDRAADLAQEVFLRIHRHLGTFRGRSSLETWIYRVTVNHCRSRLARRRPPSRPLTLDEGQEDRVAHLADPSRGPEERALAGDAARLVTAALTRLPVKLREAVVLRDLEGLPYDDIARVLGVRIGTVRSRIARGRERLRSVLQEGGRL
ncbi:MAG: RNA polymerase sigma factor [Thermoanaerobaculia bacterium]